MESLIILCALLSMALLLLAGIGGAVELWGAWTGRRKKKILETLPEPQFKQKVYGSVSDELPAKEGDAS